MAGMGIDATQTQWALVRHYDRAHPHCHLLINRVDNQGKVLPEGKNFGQSLKVCRDLEKRYGLIDAAEIGLEQQLAKAEEGKLSPYETARVYIQKALHKHVPAATDVEGLSVALAGENITMHCTYREQQLAAVVFERAGQFVKGSAISSEYGGKQLGQTLDRQQRAQEDVPIGEPGELKQVLPSQLLLPLPVESPEVAVEEPAIPVSVADSMQPKPVAQLEANELPLAVLVEQPVEDLLLIVPQRNVQSYQVEAQPVGEQLTSVPGQSSGEEPATERTQQVATEGPAVLPPAMLPTVEPISETERQACVFRDAAAGEWDSIDQAKAIVHQHLTQALNTTETNWARILQEVRSPGYDLSTDYNLLRHRESGLVLNLAEVQPGWQSAPPFIEQIKAVAAKNAKAEYANIHQATKTLLTKFVQAKLHFTDREELIEQASRFGLSISWPGAKNGQGGELTVTHVAHNYSFSHAELTVGGKPLLPQLNAAREANLLNPVRQVQMTFASETQAAQFQTRFHNVGVQLVPVPSKDKLAFTADYRLDSKKIVEIDKAFQSLRQASGSRIVESKAATQQREGAVIGHIVQAQRLTKNQGYTR
jgi:hypothetical protein